MENTVNEKNKEIELLRKTLSQAKNIEHERSFAIEKNREFDQKIRSLEKDNKNLSKNLSKKIKSTGNIMEQFASKPAKRPATAKKLEYDANPSSGRGVMSHFTPQPKRMDAKSAKELNVLEEYERLSQQFKHQNEELMRKTAEFDNLDSMYKYIGNVLKQTQKTLDEYQNDNFVLKSENNRLNSECGTLKIRNKENDSLFNQISELKTQKFSLEKKVQDMLTLESGDNKSSGIRDKIETKQLEGQIQTLNSVVIEKTTKIAELEGKLGKFDDENSKLKMNLTSTTTR
mmetsp:Transcript_23746/g.19954  ORF Transcript_23746/g.19954 Transcript_23746/m.19954 type:complete len:287 (+) Transcript_23746:280-1140(+)